MKPLRHDDVIQIKGANGEITFDLAVERMGWITSGNIWRSEYPIVHVKDGQLSVADTIIAEV